MCSLQPILIWNVLKQHVVLMGEKGDMSDMIGNIANFQSIRQMIPLIYDKDACLFYQAVSHMIYYHPHSCLPRKF